MKCPTCDKQLNSEAFHGQTVDRCVDCNGLWLDYSELGPIVRQTEPMMAKVKSTPETLSENIKCPKCRRSLVPFNYAHDSGVFINKCMSCGGTWLLPGQLELMAQYGNGTPAIRKLENALAEEMHKSSRLASARHLLRSRLLSGSIAIGYILVVLLATGNLRSVVSLIRFLLLPVACIWFPDAMGNLRSISLGLGRPMITHTTPGDVVAIGGWFLLLCPIVVALITRL